MVNLGDSRRLSRNGTGMLHNKNLCIWCMKPDDP